MRFDESQIEDKLKKTCYQRNNISVIINVNPGENLDN